jgi:hypothetical protein
VLGNRDLKVTLFPFNTLDIGKGDQLYVNVPADLDQFGRDNSHGAVVGGEGLVQLGHNPANGGGPLNQIYVKAGVGQIQGALHPGNASADHQHRSNDGFIHHHLKRRLAMLGFLFINQAQGATKNPYFLYRYLIMIGS